MKTSEFLEAVTPSQGILYAAEPASFVDKNGKTVNYYKHTVCNSHSELALNCKAISNGQSNSYFALASFAQAEYYVDNPHNPDKQKRKQRTKENAVAARSMWVDLDCGPSKEYSSQKAALADLKRAIKQAKIPNPTFIVNSGYGVHAYWAFSKDVPKEIWEPVAVRFDALMRGAGLKHDKVTANIACVLRAPGTINYKYGSEKDVTILAHKDVVRFTDWVAAIKGGIKALKVELPKERPTSNLNSALGGGMDDFPPSDADKIADRCAVLGEMRKLQGAGQDEQQWYNALGILKYTEQGEDVCQDWSSGHDDYDPVIVSDKVNHWEYGPTRCETMRQLFDACADCKLTCNSPISLGFPEPEHQTTVAVLPDEADTDQAPVIEVLPELPDEMKTSFAWSEKKGMQAKIEDDDGNYFYVSFCSQFPVPQFIFYDKIQETFFVRVTARTAPFTWLSGDIPLDVVQKGGINLVGALGGKCAITVRDDGKILARFMKTWVDIIRQSTDLQAMRDQMGWQRDGSFLLGNRLFSPDGDIRDVVVARGLAKYAESHVAQGDTQTFVDIIDQLYNRPNYEQYQFFWLASFGSILLKFLHSHSMGVTLAAYSPDSGTGKTSVCKAAIANFGDPSGFGQQADGQDGATEYAITVMAGLRHNLPILIDEITGWDNQRLGKFLYRICNGTAKMQGSADGGLRDTSSYNWNTVSYITSNAPLGEKMSTEVKNSQAMLARLFDVRFESKGFDTKDSILFEKLWQHSGNTGAEFIHYVVQNQDKVAKLCRKIMDSLSEETKAGQSARFWMMLTAVTITAGHITKMLGMHQFDMDKLRSWTVNRISEVQQNADMAMESIEDIAHSMMSDLQTGLICTIDAPNGRGDYVGFAPGYGAPRNSVSARFIVSTGDVYIPVSTAKRWCSEKNMDYTDFRRRLINKGWLVGSDVRYNIGRGTSVVSNRVRCWHLNLQSAGSVLKAVEPEGGFDAHKSQG